MTGILLVDKPEGFTSHDVIAKLRGVLRERRLGHAGTLDPMATGLLVVFAGRATRAVQFAESQSKRYLAEMRTGIVTDTQDITGNVLETTEMEISEKILCKLLPEFTGTLLQTPPMYSAVKQNGKKLYELARKGIEVERKSREITIHSLEYQGHTENHFQLSIDCSKGTYIRTLCHDIGARLGCGATLSSLRRTNSGDFSVENAHTLEEIIEFAQQGRAQELCLPVDSLFSEHAHVAINGKQKEKCLCGNSFPIDKPDGVYRVYDENGVFLMLAEAREGLMYTIKSFFEIE